MACTLLGTYLILMQKMSTKIGDLNIHMFMVYGAPQINVDPDITGKNFIGKYITCSLPCKKTYPELHELVKTLQTHHHTFTCRKRKVVNVDLIILVPHLKTL